MIEIKEIVEGLGKFVIFRHTDNPMVNENITAELDAKVLEYTQKEGNGYNHFISIHPDEISVRVVVFGVHTMSFTPLK